MSSTTAPCLCIYRPSKKLGLACHEPSVHDTPFCKSHRKNGNGGQQLFFKDVANFMKGSPNSVLSAANVYSCMDHLWTNTSTSSTTTKRSDLGIAFTAVEVIAHLCDHPQISLMAKALRIPVRAQKMSAAFDIVSVMWEVWHFGRNTKAIHALTQLQKQWRARKVHALQGPYPEVLATNDVDPFTLEPLSDLPPASIFSYWERSTISTQWRIYAFSGAEFHDYIFVHMNDTNPLTRTIIPYGVRDRLEKWHKLILTTSLQPPIGQPANNPRSAASLPLPLPPDYSPTASYNVPMPVANANAEAVSPSLAFTHIASLLESIHGICIQPQWLTELTDLYMVGIFAQFHIAVDPVSPQTRDIYMRRPVPVYNVRAYFASEMTALVQQERPPSFLVCILICTIAKYCTPLYESLPEWVYDAADM